MYLLQRCEDGFIIREFIGSVCYRAGDYKNPEYSHREVRRDTVSGPITGAITNTVSSVGLPPMYAVLLSDGATTLAVSMVRHFLI